MIRKKKIYDPVHRFIFLDELESELIHTPPFQRLHYIHQLGMSYCVYPGARHRRFEHSLGVMELATHIYDEVTKDNRLKDEPLMPVFGSFEHRYWRRVLRLAALCHDIGHLPFSHMAEKKIFGAGGHEAWTRKMLESEMFDSIWRQFRVASLEEGIDRDVRCDVIKIALGEKRCEESFSHWEKVLTEMITGDFFGADRIDYLLRDSQCTGLAYGFFDYHQLIEMLKIIPIPDEGLVLGVEENGIESCEALLLARYYMHKRLYQYSSVKSYAYHVARFMMVCDLGENEDLNRYINTTDNEVISEIQDAAKDATHPGHFDAKCLCFNDYRFRAIPFMSLCEEELISLRGRWGSAIDWELCTCSMKKIPLSFLVLKKDGAIDIGDNVSEISIPSTERNWIYIAPQYEAELQNVLNHVNFL